MTITPACHVLPLSHLLTNTISSIQMKVERCGQVLRYNIIRACTCYQSLIHAFVSYWIFSGFQIVRADLKELSDMDLYGAPYAYTPFCSSRKEMDGFRYDKLFRGRLEITLPSGLKFTDSCGWRMNCEFQKMLEKVLVRKGNERRCSLLLDWTGLYMKELILSVV